MVELETTIRNRAGIHARPSAMIAQTAIKFSSRIFLEKNGNKINAKSIMGIITLAASFGSKIRITADGSDEVAAAEAIKALFESGFNEELG
ncbi:MAG: HPr family phosphocarrier protein [Spirochaetia bacterium]|jgi:phosphocarrier protein|uniref:HPr-like protein Crh n=1 Tax=bioreactor metagenome TaxID=1076179 RepID=A0A644TUK7_9ZZZZ|nr:HPr family phosphocarrier protein [Spirochaetia bacterium]MCE1208598.1 HPr family phosphocarrier protein [Spirochaetia bacterium]NLX46149.1 HPr family phosphocarrier protein [Treponema sp.]VBB38955.1 Phosphocarrier protein HPr [uncultured Spirochaetota bacterium]HOI23460.1 HPr family phosphocarrier protein [Spirochaetales bacterium]